MTRIIYRCDCTPQSASRKARIVVAQSDPQCRTILLSPGEERASLFVSLPYMIFVIFYSGYATGARRLLKLGNLLVFFRNEPLVSTESRLSLSCFPNCYFNGYVCLGPDRCLVAFGEEALVRSVLDAFWTTEFNGLVPGKRSIDHLGPAAAHGIAMLADATKVNRRVGMEIDWDRESRRWIEDQNKTITTSTRFPEDPNLDCGLLWSSIGLHHFTPQWERVETPRP